MNNRITISNVDECFVHIQCDDGLRYELREAFTFQVPGFQFTPQYRARLWDGKIRLYNTQTSLIYRGLVPEVARFCEARNYDWSYENEAYDEEFSLIEAKEFIDTLNLPKTIQVRDYQEEAFVHAIRTRRTLLLSPTASGKSLIIYLILRYLHDKEHSSRTLIIVPTVNLVHQLYTDFAQYGYNSDLYIHRVFSGQDKQSDRPITISTWQSVYKLGKDYFESFDTIVGDECHLFKAKSLIDIMTKLTQAKYRIGTTGTLDGTKTHKLVLEGLFGSVHNVTTTKKLMDQKHLAEFNIKCLLLKHNDSLCQAARNFTYQQEIEYLILNESRNRFITNLATSLEGNTLILYQFVDKHGKILYNMLNEKQLNRRIFFVHGETDAEKREAIRHIVDNHEKDAIIVASYGTFSTGINIRNLHNIIFASPSKSRIRNLQSIGRGLRTSEIKSSATLFDIADDLRYKKKENYTLKHFASRIKIYGEEKFKFRIYKIELKG